MTTMSTIRTAGNSAQAYADRVAEGADAALATAQTLFRQGADAVRGGSRQLREETRRASTAGAYYARQHPLQTLVVGLAAVALTLSIVTLLGRRGR